MRGCLTDMGKEIKKTGRSLDVADAFDAQLPQNDFTELMSILCKPKCISENVRSIDIVGRYGGEEFSVLLINTDINECKPLAEKIVEKIAKKTYLRDGIAVNLTISAGMSGYPLHSDSIEGLIEKADKAMYITKSKGGNGVTIAE